MTDRSATTWPACGGFGYIEGPGRHRAVSFVLAAILTCSLCSPAAAQGEATDPGFVTNDMESRMPDRERAFVQLLQDARQKYESASPGLERQQSRLSMQIAVTKFVRQDPNVDNWVGIFRAVHTNPAGDRSISIEIAPGVTVATGRNRQEDPNLLTLIEPHSDEYAELDTIDVGEPVVFSARILAGRLSSDDDMVEQPLLYAHFSSLRRTR